MGIFGSRSSKLKQLKTENEELKTKFHMMYEKEENNRRLEEMLKSRRQEISEIHETKKKLLLEIESVKNDEDLKREQLNELNQRIADLYEMKEELQNTILSYSTRINSMQSNEIVNQTTAENENQKAIIQLEDKLLKLTAEEKEMRHRVTDLKEKIKKLSTSESELKEKDEILSLQLNEIAEKRANLLLENNEYAEKLRLTKDEVNGLKNTEKKLSKLIEEKNNLIKKVNGELNSLKSEIENNAANLNKTKYEEAELNNKLAVLQKEESLLKEKTELQEYRLLELTEESDKMLAHYSELQDKFQGLKREEKETMQKIAALHEIETQLLQNNENAKINNLEIDSVRIEEKEAAKNLSELREESSRIQASIELLLNSEKEIGKKITEGEKNLAENNAILYAVKSEVEGLLKILDELKEQEKNLKEKNSSLHVQELNLTESISIESNKIEEIRNDLKILFAEKIDLENTIAELREEANRLTENIGMLKEKEEGIQSSKLDRAEINEMSGSLENLKQEYEEAKANLNRLREEESTLQPKILQLKNEEILRAEYLEEISKNISNKVEEEKSAAARIKDIENEIAEKHKIYNDINSGYEKLFEETNFKQKELYAIEQSLELKNQRLNQLNSEIEIVDKKVEKAKQELGKYEASKSEIHQKMLIEKENAVKYSEQHDKLQELIPLLEERRREIEKGNSELESRFMRMFQKFNGELNEINRKRNVLEQVVLQKEKDIDEKDQQLFEKIASLEESERVLSMRQAEIEAVEQMLETIDEQKGQIRDDLTRIDEEYKERKYYNNDLKLETELLFKKRTTLEKGLQDLLAMMNQSYSKTKERKEKLEIEAAEYEARIQYYRDKIDDAVSELAELQSTLSNSKVEYQEYKGNVSKLAAMKKKLQDEISKHQVVLHRYQKIREKLKYEQDASSPKPEESSAKSDERERESESHETRHVYKT
jgi:chromosome segregation ATPase